MPTHLKSIFCFLKILKIFEKLYGWTYGVFFNRFEKIILQLVKLFPEFIFEQKIVDENFDFSNYSFENSFNKKHPIGTRMNIILSIIEQ